MEAKDIIPELRIGNLLNDREGNLCEVISLGKTDLYAPSINNPITKLPNEPIPLTEEWLLLFGFIKIEREDEDFTYFKKDNIEFCDVSPNGFELIWHELAPCDYVHQLQNLYFALTGEELTIKQHA